MICETLGTKRQEIIVNFFDLLKQEIEICKSLYNEKEANILKNYGYNKNIGKDYPRYRYSQRIKHLVEFVNIKMHVLDAGCGIGNEAILCGLLGAQVTGVDLNEDRLALAKNRVKYYNNKFNTNLDVNLSAESVLKEFDQKFDVIWSMESISHIDPAEEFIKLSYINLKSGGRLIITDPNALNLYSYLSCKKHRKKLAVHTQQRKTPKLANIYHTHRREY